jgi:A/G-specific adenine glycosylase
MPDPADVRRRLLKWYARSARELPWRVPPGGDDRPEPYHVLVSEAMLQQTQVATVIPYYHRFLAALPTVDELAAADEQQVLQLWQGLGYYRRARNLHAAAKAIVTQHDGRVPDTVERLLSLPGVGRYTAGAIASIAFGRRAPILDGNAIRVLSRVWAVADPVDQPATQRRLWSLAEQLADTPRPGDLNQAVMELGATVCGPKSPGCLTCPLRDVCEAQRRGIAESLPIKAPRKPPTRVVHRVLAVWRGGKWLVQQRPGRGLWAKMWQFPTAELAADVAGGEAAKPQQWAVEALGLEVATPTLLGHFEQVTTHRLVRVEVAVAEVVGGRKRAGVGQWRRLDRLDDLPLARPHQRVRQMLQHWVDEQQVAPAAHG